MSGQEWLAVDRKGLSQIAGRKGKAFVIFEMLQNSFDEFGVTKVEVTLGESGRGRACLKVTDDAPEGFTDLDHAFTLFAPSKKKGTVTLRGRFNLGEKFVLALCERAAIRSMTGSIFFEKDGSRVRTKKKIERGTVFEATLKLTRAEIAEVEHAFWTVIPPDHIEVTFNGKRLHVPKLLKEFEVTLPTEIAGEDGVLKPTRRKTTVKVYQPHDQALLYEMGIPVVELEDRWAYSIEQKVPLTMDRENVPPSFLKLVRTHVLNEMHSTVDAEDVTTWGREALEHDEVTDDAVQTAITKMFGNRRVSYDPSDIEANSIAVSKGYTVVHGRSLSKAAWANIRRAEAITPAGQVTPSPKIFESPDGVPPIPSDKWTVGMNRVADYTREMGKALLGFEPKVAFYEMPKM